MALVDCPDCAVKVSDQASACPHCGYPIRERLATNPANRERILRSVLPEGIQLTDDPAPCGQSEQNPMFVRIPKSRGIYIILGLLFGLMGIHNFYAGRYGAGVAQLLISLLLGWVVVGLVISGVWALIDVVTVTQDGEGQRMA